MVPKVIGILLFAAWSLPSKVAQGSEASVYPDPWSLPEPQAIVALPMPEPGEPAAQGLGDRASLQDTPGSRQPDPSIKRFFEPAPKPTQDSVPDLSQSYGQQNSKRKVFFTITFEEKGSGGNSSWSGKTQARYALLPTWDGSRGADPGLNLSKELKQRLGLRETGSAEELYKLRGSFLGLKKGDLLQFDCKEASGSGSGNVGESKHSWSRQTQDGVTTNIDDGHASTDREDYAWNADAQLLRTETGARLSFSWQSGSAEEMGISAEHPYANWSPAKRDFLAF